MVFIPVKSVGVVGDGRRYDYVVSLRAVETIDFMTARAAHLPYDFVDRVSTRIINEVAGISRVVYDISSAPQQRLNGSNGLVLLTLINTINTLKIKLF